MQRQAPDLRPARGPVSGQSCSPPEHYASGQDVGGVRPLERGPLPGSRSGANLVARRTGAVRRSRLRPVVSAGGALYLGPHQPPEPPPSGSMWLIITQCLAT